VAIQEISRVSVQHVLRGIDPSMDCRVH
jgi:hypothetical protein